jgi:hypothetical protein
MDNYSKTNSMELNLPSMANTFTMGEHSGHQFIEALKEKGKEVEGA